MSCLHAVYLKSLGELSAWSTLLVRTVLLVSTGSLCISILQDLSLLLFCKHVHFHKEIVYKCFTKTNFSDSDNLFV